MNYAEITGEFGLITSLTLSITQRLNKGRLKNLLERLREHCEKEFKKFPPMYGKVDEINRKIVSWSENCGWADEVEVITFVSFLLGLIDQSEYKYPNNIIENLNDIYDFMTDGKDFPKHCKLADHALLVWSQYEKIEWRQN